MRVLWPTPANGARQRTSGGRAAQARPAASGANQGRAARGRAPRTHPRSPTSRCPSPGAARGTSGCRRARAPRGCAWCQSWCCEGRRGRGEGWCGARAAHRAAACTPRGWTDLAAGRPLANARFFWCGCRRPPVARRLCNEDRVMLIRLGQASWEIVSCTCCWLWATQRIFTTFSIGTSNRCHHWQRDFYT